MPFRNNGTFLENIILTAISSYLLDKTNLDFVNSFAMPPLSPWVEHSFDSAIDIEFLSKIINIDFNDSMVSYPALLQLCLKKQINLGPNGALLVALIAAQKKRKLRMWLNDIPAGRYGDATKTLRQIDTIATQILDSKCKDIVEISVNPEKYPESLAHLTGILKEWSVREHCLAIIGYLDPWYYRFEQERSDVTSPQDHQRWLKLISSVGHDLVISVHFTANNQADELKEELMQMQKDGVTSGFDENRAYIFDHFAISISIYKKETCNIIIEEIFDHIAYAFRDYGQLNNKFQPENIKIFKQGEFSKLNISKEVSKSLVL